MATFHHHPDDVVFIHGDVLYIDTPDNFAVDLGEVYEFAGRERLYEPGVRHFIDDEPQSLEWVEGDAYIAALPDLITAQAARLNPPPTLDELKERAIAILLETISSLPAIVFNASQEKLAIYARKQALVNSWTGESVPTKPQVEWDGDWSQRSEYAENGWVAVEALGVRFQCETAMDLWKTWGLNTALANELDERSEPLRTRAQADIALATDEPEIQAIVTNFIAAINQLPVDFMQNIAPALITASGLTPVV